MKKKEKKEEKKEEKEKQKPKKVNPLEELLPSTLQLKKFQKKIIS